MIGIWRFAGRDAEGWQMTATKRSLAERALDELGLDKANRAVADYWLSLWQGDALPARSQFSPGRLKALLPHLLMFDVVPDESVTVRLAGTGYRQVLGEDLTGQDWIAKAPAHHRPVRLRNLTSVARGAVMGTHRRIAMVVGHDSVNEEIALPFAPDDNGVHPIVAHVDWKLDHLTKVTTIKRIEADAPHFRLLLLQ